MTNFTTVSRCVALVLALGACASARASIITDWSFGSVAAVSPDNNPAPTTGTGSASSLGMTNNYTYTKGSTSGTGSVTLDDITNDSVSGTSNGSTLGNGDVWRIRGQPGGTNANGWNTAAPQYSQGAEFDVSTAGYTNVGLSFNWAATTQGVANMQVQYTTNGTTWNNIGSVLTATIDNNTIGTAGSGFATDTVDFSAVNGVSNDALFGVRLVSAFNSTIGTYASATSVLSGTPTAINNNSGNWRIADVQIDGTAIAPVPLPASAWLMLSGLGGLVTLRRRKRPVTVTAS